MLTSLVHCDPTGETNRPYMDPLPGNARWRSLAGGTMNLTELTLALLPHGRTESMSDTADTLLSVQGPGDGVRVVQLEVAKACR